MSDAATNVRMYRTMTRIKQVDERIRSLLMSGAHAIQYYSPRGQEAIAAGVSAHLEPSDYLVTTYRGIHDQLAKGIPMDELFAEYLGRSGGTCKGKGGPMHITHPASGVMVTTGVVGGGLPIAVGLGLASQVRRDGRVTVCNFGDGASNIGAFHESLNLASVWALPVVFVCQNNRYAEHTAYRDCTPVDAVAARAAAYGMPGVTVDGNDPTAVHEAAGEAVARARAGEGPSLVEAMTYRFCGHFFGDDSTYMPAAEVSAAMEADPVPRYRSKLLAAGDASEEQLAAIEAEIEAEIDRAYDFAWQSPLPSPDELNLDVYAQEVLA